MTLAEKNDLYLKLKCGISTAATKFNTVLGQGKCQDTAISNIVTASKLLDVICRYTPCCTTTYYYSIGMTKEAPVDGNLQVQLNVAGNILSTYIGIGSAATILEHFNSDINANAHVTGFNSFIEGGLLHVWKCRVAIAGDPAPLIVETDLGIGALVLTLVPTLLINKPMENPFNCIPVTKICEIASKITTLINCNC